MNNLAWAISKNMPGSNNENKKNHVYSMLCINEMKE